jgi:transposase
MRLEYLRGYRTYWDLARSYGISESSVYKNIKWVEDRLIKHPRLQLPGKRQLAKNQMQYEVICILQQRDPIERPPKAETLLFRQAETTYHKKPGNNRSKK